jgi:hypothetical protein
MQHQNGKQWAEENDRKIKETGESAAAKEEWRTKKRRYRELQLWNIRTGNKWQRVKTQ